MLDVIVYEDEEVSINKNKRIINKGLGSHNIGYQVNIFKKYNDELTEIINNDNKKIYLINLETDNYSGLELARNIRKKHFNDIIILTAKCDKYYDRAFNNRLLAFDYICKCDEYDKRLLDTILKASNVLFNGEMFTFKYNRMIYRIPFSDINYVEKESNIKRCIIHTISGQYYIVSPIDRLIEELKCNFMRTHQSCIINLDNIRALDCVNNKVIFDNDDYTSLVTEKAKREIKNWLFNEEC